MDKTAAEVLGQAMNRKPSNGKSVWCTMVLRLMDTEEYSNNIAVHWHWFLNSFLR